MYNEFAVNQKAASLWCRRLVRGAKRKGCHAIDERAETGKGKSNAGNAMLSFIRTS